MQPIVIISASLATRQDGVNMARTAVMANELQYFGLPYREVHGVYRGTSERSFVVLTDNLHLMNQFAKSYDQECLLFSDNRRYSSLHFADGSVQGIGRLRSVDAGLAHKLENYTWDPSTGEYWAIPGW